MFHNWCHRRGMLASIAGAGLASAGGRALAGWEPVLKSYEGIVTELVMDLVVTCSAMEPTGGAETKRPGKDGVRDEIWPITGGRFWGKGLRGTVVPGGGDFPILRPDNVVVVDALYRLRTDDGVTIIIHNKGLQYPAKAGAAERYRLQPEFFAPSGKYDWLNKSLFIATLVYPVPKNMALATGPNENDRLIEVYRVV